MERTTPVASIARIHNLFDAWRALGSRRLPSETELIGAIPGDHEERWLHTLNPGLSVAELNSFEQMLTLPLSRDLRAFYRRTSGMSLWNGAFRVFGYNPVAVGEVVNTRYPNDALRLNHELDVLGWKPQGAFAFAENSWDMSVHVIGMDDNPRTVKRCDRATGEVLEVHKCVWRCLADRLNKIDGLMARCSGEDL